ncbi:hypothetical protein ACU8MB_00885 [Rhizobium leguminosarum]
MALVYRKLSAMVCFCMLASSVFSQESQPPQNNAGGNLDVYNPLTSFQVIVCGLCISVGLVVFAGQFYLLRRSTTVTPDDIVKNCTITLVIIGALVLIVAGYSSQQTAQAFGLFGTVIGYLLGRSAGKQDAKE